MNSLRRRVLPMALAVCAALALSACGEEEPTATTGDSGCEQVDTPAPKQLDLKAPTENAPTASGVALATSCGEFEISFDERAPKTAASFQHLAEEGAYDGTTFHRVIPDQLVQGGDPLGDGTGGPGYFVDEPPPTSLRYTRGTVLMAKTEAEPIGRSGSQFIVVVSADAGFTPDYALVGEVTSGFETVEAISRLGAPGEAGPPTMSVVIESASPIEGSGG